MNIPEKAIEAAVNHQRRNSSSCLCGWSELGRSHVQHQLEAAAPFIAAHALNDAATYIEDWIKAGADDPISPDETATWLRARASLIAIESEAPNA